MTNRQRSVNRGRTTAAIALILVLILCAGCLFACARHDYNADFEAFKDELTIAMFSGDAISVNFMLAYPENLGLVGQDATLPLPYENESRFREGMSSLADISMMLLNFRYSSLSRENQRDWDVINNYFYSRSLYADYYYLDQKYIGVSDGWNALLPLYLEHYTFLCPFDIDNYLSLMKQTQTAFPAYAEFELERIGAGYGRADSVYAGIAEQCDSFASDASADGNNYMYGVFAEKLAACDFLNDAQKDEYIRRHADAMENYMLPAYRDLSDRARDFEGTPGNNNMGLAHFPDGAEYYALEFASSASTSDSVDTAYANLAAAHDAVLAEYNAKVAALSQSGVDVEAEYEAMIAGKDLSKDALKGYYDALKAGYASDFPALPESIPYPEFREVPPALADSSSPASYFRSAIDSGSAPEVININPASSSGYIGFDIISHEGIPGHQLQHGYFKTSGAHTCRSLISHLGYAEGWATYAQLYSAKYYPGSATQKQVYELFCMRQEMNLYLNALLDIIVNYKGASFAEFYEFVSPMLGGQSAEAREQAAELYSYLIESPTAYSSYAYGLLKLKALRAGYQGSDLEFHTAVLSAGSMTFELLEKYL